MSYTRQTFAVKAFEQLLVRRCFGRKKFQRDRLSERQIRGAINLAHTADSKQADDPVTPAKQSSGNETAFLCNGVRTLGRRSEGGIVRAGVKGGLDTRWIDLALHR